MISALLAVALCGAAASLLGGLCWRIWRWANTPEPFQIPTTTGQQASLAGIAASRIESPSTRLGVVGRMALELLLFRSLFRNTAAGPTFGNGDVAARPVFLERKGLWLGALAFHWSLLVVAVRHLRLFVDPVPRAVSVLAAVDGFFQVGSPHWYVTDVILIVALGYLLGRRLANPLLRYLTLPADYLALGSLLAAAGTGIVLRYVARTDLVAVRQFTLGLVSLAPTAMPAPGFWLGAHLLSVAFLLAILPMTKMVHAAGAWFSPTRNQRNDSRRRRHVNPWNAPVKVHSYEAWEDEFRDKLLAAGIPLDPTGPKAGALAGARPPVASRESRAGIV
jgi:nitrate reductase gamma subunit